MDLLMDHVEEINTEIHKLETGAKFLRRKLHSGDTSIMQETRRAMETLEHAIDVFSDALSALEALDASLPYTRRHPVAQDGQAA